MGGCGRATWPAGAATAPLVDFQAMAKPKTLAEALRSQHEEDMIRRAELIRDWQPGDERNDLAMMHVRQALHECPRHIDDKTRYRIYSILNFVMPDDSWHQGEQVPDEVLEEQAAWEIEYQKQLEQRSCPECGDGVCPVDK